VITLLENADIHAPEALGLGSVAVAGGTVVAVGALPPLDDAWVAERIDCGGRALVSGFVDCHAHLSGGGGEDGASTKVPAPQLSAYTTAGVTSVVGLLGTDDTTRTTKELLAAVRGLREQGLNAWAWTGGYHLPPTTLSGSVKDDLTHVTELVGVGEVAISDHRSSQPTLDELLRIASEAHVAGLLTRKAGVLHLHLGDGERGLDLVRRALDESELPPRVFHPTHVNRRKALFEEGLELARRGVHLDFTAFPVAADEDAWPAEVALAKALDAGITVERLSVSSDGGGCLPEFDADGRMTRMDVGSPSALPETLAKAIELGVPTATALAAFTSSPADYLRLSGKGRIAPGMDADLQVLGAGGHPDDVMIRGLWHVRDGVPVRRGVFES
jgi:beta-aspartyl-dipeptidase (metallo-type)